VTLDLLHDLFAHGLVVEASAGTGKTYSVAAIVTRELALNEDRRIGKILITTFTRNAAAELRDRVRRRLVETVGAAWARYILLTGELLDAGTAQRIGLVHEVVPDDQVVSRGHALARTVRSRAQVSLVGGKAMVDRVVHGLLDEDDDVGDLDAQSAGVAAGLLRPCAARRASSPPAATARSITASG